MTDSTKLNEFDKDEWRDVSRKLRPDWTEEQFEEAWQEFVALKQHLTEQKDAGDATNNR